MSGGLFQLPRVVPLSGGAVLPGAKLNFYLSGTSTPTDVYQDIELTTPHASPVVADAGGVFAPIFLDPELEDGYRVKLTTSADVLVYQDDDVFAPGDSSARYDVVGGAPEIVLSETDQDVNNRKFRFVYANKQLLIQLGNEAESVWTTAIAITRDGSTNEGVELTTGPTTISEAIVQAFQTGSFTPTWAGFSSAPTGDVFWEKAGDRVTLKFPTTNTGTSNSTSFSVSGLPAEIRPNTASAPRYPCVVIDNNVNLLGAFGFFTPAGRILFYTDDLTSTTDFTASGTKGLPSFACLMYSIGQ